MLKPFGHGAWWCRYITRSIATGEIFRWDRVKHSQVNPRPAQPLHQTYSSVGPTMSYTQHSTHKFEFSVFFSNKQRIQSIHFQGSLLFFCWSTNLLKFLHINSDAILQGWTTCNVWRQFCTSDSTAFQEQAKNIWESETEIIRIRISQSNWISR